MFRAVGARIRRVPVDAEGLDSGIGSQEMDQRPDWCTSRRRTSFHSA